LLRNMPGEYDLAKVTGARDRLESTTHIGEASTGRDRLSEPSYARDCGNIRRWPDCEQGDRE
jgi:hypothetical protein